MEEITLKPSRFLPNKEFKEYVRLVRKIARFDPLKKLWIVDPIILKRNFTNKAEALLLINKLKSYVNITPETESLFKELVNVTLSDVVFDIDNLTMKVRQPISRTIYSEIKEYVRYEGNRIFRVKSVLFLDRICNILDKYKVNYYPSRKDIEEAKGRLLRCYITRDSGDLVIKLAVPDEYVIRKLRSACTVKYFIERALFDEEGNFLETIREEREIKLLKVAEKGRELRTSVGLIDRVLKELHSLGFQVKVDIAEKANLSKPLSMNFELLPHQKIAYELWHKKKRGTIAIFTRGGKSFIAMRAIYDLKKPTLILVTTRELAGTWKRYLNKYLGLNEHEIGYLGEGKKDIKPITIAIYNSCVKYIDLVKEKFELLICDESHHVPANTFKNVVIKMDSLYRMALSATPKRRDGNEELLFSLCGPLIINLDYKELLTLRIVAPIEVFETKFMAGEEEKLKELIRILHKHQDEKAIVFTQYISTATKVFNSLLREGFKATLITGSTPSMRRKRAFDEFLKGRVKVIVTTTVLDEGITVPDAEVAVIYEGSGEARQMIQRVGRVLGYLPGKTAKVYELVDILNPREKRAYFRRKWVRELYMFPEVKEFVLKEKSGVKGETLPKFAYQARLDLEL